jgi:hypothetical protein
MRISFIIVLALFVLVFLLAAGVKIRILRRAKQRQGLTAEEFVHALVAKGIPQEIARSVFAGFHKWASCISADFPLTSEVPLRHFTPGWIMMRLILFTKFLVRPEGIGHQSSFCHVRQIGL